MRHLIRHAVMPPDSRNNSHGAVGRAVPITGPRGKETQAFGTIARLPIALDDAVCAASVKSLNQILADTMTLRDLYKKHHWQVSGETFSQLHLLFDKHYEEQAKLIDDIAERIQLLGGLSGKPPGLLMTTTTTARTISS
jgi:starvation-inducible DNA-binding protein